MGREALTVRLDTGHLAHYQRNEADCMRAALATLAQVPYDEVPDVGAAKGSALAQSQVLVDLGAWANERGWRLTYHSALPADREMWIGGIAADEFGPSHAVVMHEDRVAFDPAWNFPLPPGHQLIPITVGDLAFGITLDPKESR